MQTGALLPPRRYRVRERGAPAKGRRSAFTLALQSRQNRQCLTLGEGKDRRIGSEPVNSEEVRFITLYSCNKYTNVN